MGLSGFCDAWCKARASYYGVLSFRQVKSDLNAKFHEGWSPAGHAHSLEQCLGGSQ